MPCSLRFGLDGNLPLEPFNPYPCLSVIWAEKGMVPIFRDFFLKYRPLFCNFWLSHQNDPQLKDIFFTENGNHAYGFLVKK